MQSDDSSGILIDSDGLAPVKPIQPKTGKRGRKQDNTLPPSRSRDVQRAFRARRAEKISGLEARVKQLEDENALLRSKLGMKEAEPWVLPPPSTSTPVASTSSTTATQREGYANQFDANPTGATTTTMAQGQAQAQQKKWIVPPSHLGNNNSLAASSSTSTTPGYDPSFPSPSASSSSAPPTWASSTSFLPPSSSTSSTTLPRSLPLPLTSSSLPPPTLTDEQRQFLTTCCSVPVSDLSISPTPPYHLFCASLLHGLLPTGKGRSGRLSHDSDNPNLPPRDISISLSPSPSSSSASSSQYEDSPSNDSIRPGFVSALVAWSALQGLNVNPGELATYLVQSAGGPGDGTANGGGQGIRSTHVDDIMW
ncbi:hypothetical protein RQP46_005331 [Phenoliferia psychrophenolica]